MKFNLNIQNLGNIQNADVEIRPFTLIAGKNSSGKSFITKSLYSVLDALNNNYIENELIINIRKIKKNLDLFHSSFSNIVAIDQDFIERFYKNHIDYLEDFFDIYEDFTDTFIDNLILIKKDIEEYLEKRSTLKKFKNKIKFLKFMIEAIETIIQVLKDKRTVIIKGIEKNLNDNFKKNYQITSLNPIVNENSKNKHLQINMDGIGKITIDKESLLDFEFKVDGVEKIQNLSNVVYLDSPVYIKMKKALEKNIFNNILFNKSDRYLNKYPLYIEKLYELLDKKYIDQADFEDIHKEITTIINGELEVNSSGEVEYLQKSGKSIQLSLTAMGITNLGIISLLLKNNIINKGSFLIIDEPEINLHPQWQVELAKLLYKVAQAGANVIIATHSIDIVKTVELLIKEDDEDIIAINKMPFDGEFIDKSKEEKIKDILTDLSTPFYNLYMEGL